MLQKMDVSATQALNYIDYVDSDTHFIHCNTFRFSFHLYAHVVQKNLQLRVCIQGQSAVIATTDPSIKVLLRGKATDHIKIELYTYVLPLQ